MKKLLALFLSLLMLVSILPMTALAETMETASETTLEEVSEEQEEKKLLGGVPNEDAPTFAELLGMMGTHTYAYLDVDYLVAEGGDLVNYVDAAEYNRCTTTEPLNEIEGGVYQTEKFTLENAEDTSFIFYVEDGAVTKIVAVDWEITYERQIQFADLLAGMGDDFYCNDTGDSMKAGDGFLFFCQGESDEYYLDPAGVVENVGENSGYTYYTVYLIDAEDGFDPAEMFVFIVDSEGNVAAIQYDSEYYVSDGGGEEGDFDIDELLTMMTGKVFGVDGDTLAVDNGNIVHTVTGKDPVSYTVDNAENAAQFSMTGYVVRVTMHTGASDSEYLYFFVLDDEEILGIYWGDYKGGYPVDDDGWYLENEHDKAFRDLLDMMGSTRYGHSDDYLYVSDGELYNGYEGEDTWFLDVVSVKEVEANTIYDVVVVYMGHFPIPMTFHVEAGKVTSIDVNLGGLENSGWYAYYNPVDIIDVLFAAMEYMTFTDEDGNYLQRGDDAYTINVFDGEGSYQDTLDWDAGVDITEVNTGSYTGTYSVAYQVAFEDGSALIFYLDGSRLAAIEDVATEDIYLAPLGEIDFDDLLDMMGDTEYYFAGEDATIYQENGELHFVWDGDNVLVPASPVYIDSESGYYAVYIDNGAGIDGTIYFNVQDGEVVEIWWWSTLFVPASPLETVTLTVNALRHGEYLPEYLYCEETDMDYTISWYTAEEWAKGEDGTPVDDDSTLRRGETYYLTAWVESFGGFVDAPEVSINGVALVPVGNSEKFYVIDEDEDTYMQVVYKMTVGMPIVHNELTVMKSDGTTPALENVDYRWYGNELYIRSDDLIVTGTTEKEYIYVDEDVTKLTLQDVSFLNNTETNAIYVGGEDLDLTLNNVSILNKVTNYSDIYANKDLKLTMTGGSVEDYSGFISANGDLEATLTNVEINSYGYEVIYAGGDIKVTLDGAYIKGHGYEIIYASSGDVELILAPDSENTLIRTEDGYEWDECIYTNGDLTVGGSGSLYVENNTPYYCLSVGEKLQFAYGVGRVELRSVYDEGVLYASNIFPIIDCEVKGSVDFDADSVNGLAKFEDGYAWVYDYGEEDWEYAKALTVASQMTLHETHELQVKKADGSAAAYGTDYCWVKDGSYDTLYILSDGLTVSGTTTNEVIYVYSNDLTLGGVSITVSDSANKYAIYSNANLNLVLADGSENKLVNHSDYYECIYVGGDLIFSGSGSLYATADGEDAYAIGGWGIIFTAGVGEVVTSSAYGAMQTYVKISMDAGCTVTGSDSTDGAAADEIADSLTGEVYFDWNDDGYLRYEAFMVDGNNHAEAVKISGGTATNDQSAHTLQVSKLNGTPVYGIDYYWGVRPDDDGGTAMLTILNNDLVISGGTESTPAKEEAIYVGNGVNKVTLNGVYIENETDNAIYAWQDSEICLQDGSVNVLETENWSTICGVGDLTFSGGGSLTVDCQDDNNYAIWVNGTLSFGDDFGELIARGGSQDSEEGAVYIDGSRSPNIPDGYSIYGAADRTAAEIDQYCYFNWDSLLSEDNSYACAVRIVKDEEPEEHDLEVSFGDSSEPVEGVDYEWKYGNILCVYTDDMIISGETGYEGICVYADSLTLDNVTIQSEDADDNILWVCNESLTLTLVGENVLEQIDGNGYSVIWAPYDLTIQGDGSLEINSADGDSDCIYAGRDLTITGSVTVTAENDSEYTTIWADGDIILGTVANAKLLRAVSGGVTLAARNDSGSALGCEGALVIGDGVDSMVLRGNDEEYGCGAMELRGMPLVNGLYMYGSSDIEADADELTTPAVIRALAKKIIPTEHIGDIHPDEYDIYSAFVGDDVAKTVVICGEERSAGDTFTVTFDANGGCWSDTKAITTNDDGTLPKLPKVFRLGYKFMGWYTASGEEVVLLETEFTEDTTVYAKWEKAGIIPIFDGCDFVKTMLGLGGAAVVAATVTVARAIVQIAEEVGPTVREGITLLETALVINVARVLLYGFDE